MENVYTGDSRDSGEVRRSIYNAGRLRRFGRVLYEGLIGWNPLIKAPALGIATSINSRMGDEAEKTAVLISKGHVYRIRRRTGELRCNKSRAARNIHYLSDVLSYLPEIIIDQNLRGRKVDVYHKATKDDLEDVLRNPKYQHIVLSAHGNSIGWEATDGMVYESDLDSLDFERKEGEVLKMTCGDGREDEFVPKIAEDPDRGFYFDWLPNPPEQKSYLNGRILEAVRSRRERRKAELAATTV